MNKTLSLALIAAAIASPAFAQTAKTATDTASTNNIVLAAYEIISGPAGEQRDWDRFRALFLPQADMTVVGYREGKIAFTHMTPDEYVTRSGANLQKNGFFEKEVKRRTDGFGQMATVSSMYESRHLAADEKPFARGINSFQLVNDGTRWWIANMIWEGENAMAQIPVGVFEKAPPPK
jgi:hypothetical protein